MQDGFLTSKIKVNEVTQGPRKVFLIDEKHGKIPEFFFLSRQFHGYGGDMRKGTFCGEVKKKASLTFWSSYDAGRSINIVEERSGHTTAFKMNQNSCQKH